MFKLKQLNYLFSLFLFLLASCGKGDTIIQNEPVPGPSGLPGSKITIILLCPQQTINGPMEELLIIDGKLYGLERIGQTSFLSLKLPGSYFTVDARTCPYTVNSDYSITY